MAMNFQTSGGLQEVARQYGLEVRVTPRAIWVNFYVLGARASRKFNDYRGEGHHALEMFVERWIRDYGPQIQKLNQDNPNA
jgi:hypothetical protein